jgi:hypothetical protein
MYNVLIGMDMSILSIANEELRNRESGMNQKLTFILGTNECSIQ